MNQTFWWSSSRWQHVAGPTGSECSSQLVVLRAPSHIHCDRLSLRWSFVRLIFYTLSVSVSSYSKCLRQHCVFSVRFQDYIQRAQCRCYLLHAQKYFSCPHPRHIRALRVPSIHFAAYLPYNHMFSHYHRHGLNCVLLHGRSHCCWRLQRSQQLTL